MMLGAVLVGDFDIEARRWGVAVKVCNDEWGALI